MDELLVLMGIFFILGLVLKILKDKDKPLEDYANTPENRRKEREHLIKSRGGSQDGGD